MKHKRTGTATKIVSLLLTLVMMAGLLPVTASADATTVIENVEITGVVAPVEGETPKYDCIIPEGCGYYIDEVFWFDSSYTMVDEDDTFVAGSKYTIEIVLYPEEGYSFKDRKELAATVNEEKAGNIGFYANEPESRIIQKSMYAFHKDEQIIDVSSWGELKNAFDEANKDYMSPMAAENITVRLQNDLYLNAYDLPRSTRYMVRLNVLRNITLDFNGHTLYGTADLPQDENSELESFLEFKVHPNYYIKDMQTVLTFKDSAGGGGVDFDISQWKDSQLAAIHVDYVNTYWVEGYLNGKRTYIEQSTGYWVCKVIFDGGNYKMNCDTVKFSNGTKSVGDRVRYRGTVVVTNIQTEVNGGRYEAYCDGVTVKNDNFGARDLAAFGIESIYTGNSFFADPESEYYEKYKYGEDLTINDGIFISDNGYSVRHFDRFWQGDDNDVKFDYFIAPMLNGGIYVGPVNFSSKSFIYMNDGSPYLNKKDLTKMTDPKCSLVLDGKPKTASQITLGDLADEDTEFFAILGNTYCSMKDVSLNGTNLGKDLRGTCNTGTNNTLTWTYEDLPQEMQALGFRYQCKIRDNKGGEWRYVTPSVTDGIGSVDHAIAAQTAGTLQPAFMLELCYGDSVMRYGGYAFRLAVQELTGIYRVSATWVDQPIGGARPNFSCSTSLSSKCEVSSTAWYNETDGKALTSSDVFETGKRYVFTAGIKANSGYVFAPEDQLKVYFNRDLKASYDSVSSDRTQIYYSYSFVAAQPLSSAGATVNDLEPFTSYGSKSGVAAAPDKYTVDIDVFGLYEATDADEINVDDSCRIVVGFIPEEGYAFPDPQSNTVTATINGKQATYYDYFDGSIWFYIDHYFATYKFNEVSFRYNEPVAGKSIDDFMLSIENWSQKPNDIITIEDIYWADNGTDGNWDWIDMQEGDTFLEGHNYTCAVTFGLSDSDFYMYASEDDFTVNANGASIPSVYSKDENDTIYYDPSTGAHKDFTVNMYFRAGEDHTVYSAGITTQTITDGMTVSQADPKANLSGVYTWLQLDGDDGAVRLEDTDRFKAGKTYRLMADLNTPEGKVFAPNATATVNSTPAVVDMIYADTLCVHYDFTVSGDSTSNPFKDVKESDYYYDSVLWAVENGITDGITPTTFSPNMKCTRAHAVTFLWRSMGSPEPSSSTNPFKDVKEGAYYYKAVLWAVEKGITDGVTPTSFAPEMQCTRAHAVTFLWRMAGKPAPGSSTNPFKDVKADAYYYQSVLWAVEKGITDGVTPTSFAPDMKCTRAHIVTFLYRYRKA